MNTVPIKNACPKCGSPLADDAPQGLCPKCLLAAVSTPTEASQPAAARSSPPSLEAVAAAFPQLEIVELIGHGGMGVVYKARQPKLDRFVALKLLPHALAADPAFTERFNREARVLARLNHPNIVTVHDFGQSGGFFFLLMEFVDGVNLRQAMQASRFTPQQALTLVPKVCEALQFAHDEGILHRDIKPENILLDSKGRVKIADFGIAKLIGDRGTDVALTASGAAVGTLHYMAPEQLERPQEVDQRADIYSLGVVFYEMLTGELPLGRFAPPSQKTPMDPRVDEVVLRALEKEREKRFQSAGEVKTSVEHLTRPQGPPGAGAEGPSYDPDEDFVLCPPRLPRMAKAIIVYTLMVAPLMWIVGLFTFEALPDNALAAFIEGAFNVLSTVGDFLLLILLAIGGWKLRGLRPSAPGWLQVTLWLHLGFIALAIAGQIWVIMAVEELAPEAPLRSLHVGDGVMLALILAALVFEISALVWLRRHMGLLKSFCASRTPGKGPHGTRVLNQGGGLGPSWSGKAIASAIFGAPAWLGAIGLLVLGLFVAVVAATNKNMSFGPSIGPAEMGVFLVLVAVPGLVGIVLGAMALSDMRTAPDRLRGTWLAVFGIGGLPVCLLQALLIALAALATSLMWSGPQYLVVPVAMSFGPLAGLAAGLALVRLIHRRAVSAASPPPGPPANRPGRRLRVSPLAVALILLALGAVGIPLGVAWFTPRKAPGRDNTLSAAATLRPYPNQAPSKDADRVFNGLLEVPAGHMLLLEARLWSNGVALPVSNLTALIVAPRERPHRDLLAWRILAVGDAGNRGAGWNVTVGGGTNPVLYPPPQGAERPDWQVPEFAGEVEIRPGASRPVRMLRGSGLAADGSSVTWEATLDLRLVQPKAGEELHNEESLVGLGTNVPVRIQVLSGHPKRTASVEVSVPPRETFIVTGIVLSNGVPVSGRDLRAKLWPPSVREPSRYLVRWQTLAEADSVPIGTPWEIVIEEKPTGRMAARLRPKEMPRVTWTVPAQAQDIGLRKSSHEAWAFEVAQARQTTGGGNVGAADWSVRLQFQSSPPQPTESKRGIEAEFVLPANQVAIFEVVTRSNRAIVPVPGLAAYVVNGANEPYKGKFLWADDPDDLDSLTALPRWSFGIIGPGDRMLEQGVGVPSAPAGFTGWLELWTELKPDTEIIEGLSNPDLARPAFGLRIRTQAFQAKPGLRYNGSGFGTNWLKEAASRMAPTEP